MDQQSHPLAVRRQTLRIRSSARYRPVAQALAGALGDLGAQVETPEEAISLAGLASLVWPRRRGRVRTSRRGAGLVLHCRGPDELCSPSSHPHVHLTWCDTATIPAVWVAAHCRYDRMIVPTATARDTLISAGAAAAHIQVCPLGINAAPFQHIPTPIDLWNRRGEELHRYRVRFLTIATDEPRDNLLGVLQAWIRATSRDDDAVLVVHLRPLPEPRREALRLAIAALVLDIGVGLDRAAPVWFHHDPLPVTDMPRLYAVATHYITLCRGTGWDQQALEAAACGLSLIVPNHSMYAACFEQDMASLIDSREAPCTTAKGISMGSAYAGLRWWEPDLPQAVASIRGAIDGDIAFNAAARDRVFQWYTWEHAGRRLLTLLADSRQ